MDIPNLDKMRLNKSESQAIGEFIEWLGTRGLILGKFYDNLTDLRTCYQCGGTGEVGSSRKPCSNCDGAGHYEIQLDTKFMPAGVHIEELLAEYFGIDLKEAEKEKRALLEQFRASQ